MQYWENSFFHHTVHFSVLLCFSGWIRQWKKKHGHHSRSNQPWLTWKDYNYACLFLKGFCIKTLSACRTLLMSVWWRQVGVGDTAWNAEESQTGTEKQAFTAVSSCSWFEIVSSECVPHVKFVFEDVMWRHLCIIGNKLTSWIILK